MPNSHNKNCKWGTEMEPTYIIVVAAVTCITIGGGYLLYRRSSRGGYRQYKNNHLGRLTLQEIARMASREEEEAERDGQFTKQGQLILTHMQEMDQTYKRWEHAKKH
jgi:hypothetical protein